MAFPKITQWLRQRTIRNDRRRAKLRRNEYRRRLFHIDVLEDRLLLASVWTGLADYAPGATAQVSGSGFALGETVELQVLHIDGTPNTGGGHEPWQVTDGGAGDLDGQIDGNFQTTWYVNPDDSAGATFQLTATGLFSGQSAHTNFTDGFLTNLVINSGAINENAVFTLNGSFDDPGTLDVHTVTVNWGEGAPEVFVLPVGARTFSASHPYLDDNPTGTSSDVYPISVTVADDTGSVFGSTTVEVTNVAPVVTNLAVTSSINENGVAHLTGDISDPGTQDTFTVIVNWGEGPNQTFTLAAGSTSFDFTHQYLDDNPTGTPADSYPVTIDSLTDDDGGTANTPPVGGNLFLTGHDIMAHGNQNGYSTVILDYLRNAGQANEIARGNYDVGILSLSSVHDPAGTSFGNVTRGNVTLSFATSADFAAFLANIDVLVIPEIFGSININKLNSFAPQIAAFVNAGGDLYVDTSNG